MVHILSLRLVMRMCECCDEEKTGHEKDKDVSEVWHEINEKNEVGKVSEWKIVLYKIKCYGNVWILWCKE